MRAGIYISKGFSYMLSKFLRTCVVATKACCCRVDNNSAAYQELLSLLINSIHIIIWSVVEEWLERDLCCKLGKSWECRDPSLQHKFAFQRTYFYNPCLPTSTVHLKYLYVVILMLRARVILQCRSLGSKPGPEASC